MVTEEALPSYMNMLNLLDGTRDISGASDEPWAVWTRAWTGEENRHGDLLNKYLYLSGRCAAAAAAGPKAGPHAVGCRVSSSMQAA